MCGIAGLMYHDAGHRCSEQTMVAMRDIMEHRGPDDAGLYLDGPVGLAHRRLSIIDLGGGHQPMTDADGRRWIVFNGEIYNYRELRQGLVDRGHRMQTSSDTEVILRLYEERGADCVHALNGMFAFAIWDTVDRTLFLARDRMGVKPLYYSSSDEAFSFASEMKALFASGLVAPACREDAAAEYLLFRQVAGPETLFRGVHSLQPGHVMTVKDGQIDIRPYWSLLPANPPEPLGFDDALARFEELFVDAVRLRLISDVPVGTFCSGGVDSSLVTAIAARLKAEPVNTYSIGFDETDFDESTFARMAATHCHSVHHQLNVGNEEFSELLPSMIWHNDEPLDFPNSVHIFALSRLARDKVTVVLTGEGSDELFAGYPRYRRPALAGWYRRVPSPFRRAISTLTRDHRLAKMDRDAAMPPDDVLLHNAGYLSPDAGRLLAPSWAPADLGYRRAALARTSHWPDHLLTRVSLLDQQTFLVGILNRQDKMSMAASIESRVPFMDYRLVEFANGLPDTCKVQGRSGKTLVKAFARKHLPPSIVDRRKSGFGVPLARWMRADAGLGARIQALPDQQGSAGLDRSTLRSLVSEHRSGSHDHSELLWTALNLTLWREAFRC